MRRRAALRCQQPSELIGQFIVPLTPFRYQHCRYGRPCKRAGAQTLLSLPHHRARHFF